MSRSIMSEAIVAVELRGELKRLEAKKKEYETKKIKFQAALEALQESSDGETETKTETETETELKTKIKSLDEKIKQYDTRITEARNRLRDDVNEAQEKEGFSGAFDVNDRESSKPSSRRPLGHQKKEPSRYSAGSYGKQEEGKHSDRSSTERFSPFGGGQASSQLSGLGFLDYQKQEGRDRHSTSIAREKPKILSLEELQNVFKDSSMDKESSEVEYKRAERSSSGKQRGAEEDRYFAGVERAYKGAHDSQYSAYQPPIARRMLFQTQERENTASQLPGLSFLPNPQETELEEVLRDEEGYCNKLTKLLGEMKKVEEAEVLQDKRKKLFNTFVNLYIDASKALSSKDVKHKQRVEEILYGKIGRQFFDLFVSNLRSVINDDDYRLIKQRFHEYCSSAGFLKIVLETNGSYLKKETQKLWVFKGLEVVLESLYIEYLKEKKEGSLGESRKLVLKKLAIIATPDAILGLMGKMTTKDKSDKNDFQLFIKALVHNKKIFKKEEEAIDILITNFEIRWLRDNNVAGLFEDCKDSSLLFAQGSSDSDEVKEIGEREENLIKVLRRLEKSRSGLNGNMVVIEANIAMVGNLILKSLFEKTKGKAEVVCDDHKFRIKKGKTEDCYVLEEVHGLFSKSTQVLCSGDLLQKWIESYKGAKSKAEEEKQRKEQNKQDKKGAKEDKKRERGEKRVQKLEQKVRDVQAKLDAAKTEQVKLDTTTKASINKAVEESGIQSVEEGLTSSDEDVSSSSSSSIPSPSPSPSPSQIGRTDPRGDRRGRSITSI